MGKKHFKMSVGKNGVWYLEFDGEWTSREFKLYGDKALIGGIDTGVCSKTLSRIEFPTSEPEITPEEFEGAWQKYTHDREYLKTQVVNQAEEYQLCSEFVDGWNTRALKIYRDKILVGGRQFLLRDQRLTQEEIDTLKNDPNTIVIDRDEFEAVWVAHAYERLYFTIELEGHPGPQRSDLAQYVHWKEYIEYTNGKATRTIRLFDTESIRSGPGWLIDEPRLSLGRRRLMETQPEKYTITAEEFEKLWGSFKWRY